MFSIFADATTARIAVQVESAYEASALINAYMDAGYRVSSDMWDSFIPNAMVTPSMVATHLKGDAVLPAPDQYVITYESDTGTARARTLPASGIERVGRVVAKMADREKVWNICVRDIYGGDVTLDFKCFQD